MNVEWLTKRRPRLWHVAAGGSWELIRAHGLRSTAYLACGEAFAELLERWHAALDLVEAIDRLLDQAGPVLDHLSSDERERLARDLLPAVRPVPATFVGFLEALIEACFDQRGLGLEGEGIAPAAAKALHAAGVPDLRGTARKLEASGRIPRSNAQPAWG